MINYNDYKQILKADVVRVYDLIGHFKKDEIEYDRFGNIFIGFNKNSKGLPILVAHTDNVLGDDKEPIFDLNKRCISGKNNGIGFDDKAGIIAIIELWKRFKKQKFRIILPADEETGGNGSQKIDETIYADAKWILELDRKGGHDLIQNSGGTRLCSDEFASKWEEMGFKKAQGTFTDVNIFKPKAPTINMMNMSIGYYNPHTDAEYLDTVDFERIVDCVEKFIKADYEFEPDEKDVVYDDYGHFHYDWRKNSHYDWEDLDKDEYLYDMCDLCGNELDPRKAIRYDGMLFCCEDCLKEYKEQMNIKE